MQLQPRQQRTPTPSHVVLRHVDSGHEVSFFSVDAREAISTGKWVLATEVAPVSLKQVAASLPSLEEIQEKEMEILLMLNDGFASTKKLAESVGFEKAKGTAWKDCAYALALHILTQEKE